MQGKPTATAYDDGHGHANKRRATCTATPGCTVQNGAKCASQLFVLLRALLDRGVFSFFQVHPKPEYHIVPLSHTQPPQPLPYPTFHQSPTNLIPKPFFAHNFLPIHHHFLPLTPHSHLFHAHSISFRSHSFYP